MKDSDVTLTCAYGEIIRMIGCPEHDCDCTTFIVTKPSGGKSKQIKVHLSREGLEMLRENIDDILEYHDSKGLGGPENTVGLADSHPAP